MFFSMFARFTFPWPTFVGSSATVLFWTSDDVARRRRVQLAPASDDPVRPQGAQPCVGVPTRESIPLSLRVNSWLRCVRRACRLTSCCEGHSGHGAHRIFGCRHPHFVTD
jgi:hypothetical protein